MPRSTLASLRALPLVAACMMLAVVSVSSSSVVPGDDLVNANVERKIDVSGNIERHAITIEIENTASSGSVSTYVLAVHPTKAEHLSYIVARQDSEELVVRRATDEMDHATLAAAAEGTEFFVAKLRPALKSGESVTIKVETVFTHTLVPLPEEIEQGDNQLVQFSDNHYLYSPYKTQRQTAKVRLASSAIESRSSKKPSKVSGNTVEYGPYSNAKPFAASRMHAHYENNAPFATFTRVVKEVEVSHWGNVAFEEHYDLLHTGAKLRGSFSRFEYQQHRGTGAAGPSSFRTLRAHLPAGVLDGYYRDQIGNISTSNLRLGGGRRESLLELDPRFPMFGGWKTDFYIGYNVPAEQMLSVDAADPSTFVLNITFSTGFEHVVVDHLTLRIVLPEGATDVRYVPPFEMESEQRDVRMTYLDTVGRPVLIVTKSNLVEYHNQYIQVVYKFSNTGVYWEPMLLVIGFLIFFGGSIAYMSLDFSITPPSMRKTQHGNSSSSVADDDDVDPETRRLVEDLCELYDSAHEKLSGKKSDRENFVKQMNMRLAELKNGELTREFSELATAARAAGKSKKDPQAMERLQEAERQFHASLTQLL